MDRKFSGDDQVLNLLRSRYKQDKLLSQSCSKCLILAGDLQVKEITHQDGTKLWCPSGHCLQQAEPTMYHIDTRDSVAAACEGYWMSGSCQGLILKGC